VKVGFPGGPRLEWYDRNPYHRFQSYHGEDVAPHVQTTRWSYTVPYGKKAFVESAFVYVERATAAGTARLAQSQIEIQPFGQSTNYLLLVALRTNTVGDHDHEAMGNGPILLVGDAVGGYTVDTSTGGTVDYTMDAKITEFDA